jgi:large repetitive protein
MKKLTAITLAIGLTGIGQLFAQSIVVGASPTSLPCGGGNVNLTANGNSSNVLFSSNFNGGSVGPGWLVSPAAQFNNPCGASMDGTPYLWMGAGTTAPRIMQTASLNMSCGGSVCFNFKFACESCVGDVSPCEGADLYNEGVSLQYSITGGASWIDIAYFAPNGTLLTTYPGAVTTPIASGANAFTSWQNYCFTIPTAAQTPTTMFRLFQWGAMGAAFDHWGIDNFNVYTDPCGAGYYYDWAHIPGAPNSQNVTTNISETTTFTCCYTNGINSACGSVTVTTPFVPDAVITVVANVTCAGVTDGNVIVDNPGGDGPYDLILTGPVNDTYTEGNGPPDDANIDGLLAGDYIVTTITQDGCENTQTFTIGAATNCCTVTATSTPATCFGGTNGTATANPGTVVAPVTYTWFNSAMVPIGQTTQTASGLAAGTYNVTVTDAIGCSISTSIVVGQPASAVNATAIAVSPLCFGSCNGVISVNPPTGGTAPYTYSLNGGAFQASGVFNGLCQGTYSVTVKDFKNCTFTFNVVVNQPNDLTLTLVSTNPATCGLNDGDATVTSSGGTGIKTYSTPGVPSNTTGVFSNNLSPGNHLITVTDANGCTETLNVTIVAQPAPAPFISVQNNVACNGAFTGSVTVGVVGGTAPLQYKLDAGANQASNFFGGITAGLHTITVTDVNGCTGTVNFTITQPTALTFNTVVVNALCNGDCNGQITVNASNATPPYQYSSNNGLTFQVSNVLTGLCAGNIAVVVKDANGCLANATVPVGQPPVLNSVQGFVDPVCHQTPTGEISFAPAGGTPGYTFSVDGGTTFAPANPVTGLMAGVYDVVVEDNNGCQFASSVTLTDPPPFDFVFIANNPSNCGAQDGSFEIIATAGVGPYLYSIDGGVTTQLDDGFFLNLFAGLYILVVEDANGCVDSVFSALSDNVMVTQTDLTVDVTCYNGTDGAGVVSQQFGAPPFTYTLTPTLTPGTTTNGTGVFTNLAADTYYVTIQDAGLCIAIEQFVVGGPDSVTFTPTPTEVTCNGGADGEISIGPVIGGNGGPYTYSIDGGASYQASPIFTGLTAGIYSVYAKDGNGCLGAIDVEVEEPVPFNVIINATDLTCNGNNSGFVQMVAAGSNPGPYTYTLGAMTNGTGLFVGLAANNYAVTITDVLGCPFNTMQVVNEPPPLAAGYVITDATCNGLCDGEVDVAAAGGTPPYLYSSDGGVTLQPGNILTGLCAGNNSIFVKDANSCSIVSVQIVGEPTLLTMGFVTNEATCGLNNGDLTINANNGTPGYEYSIDGGVTFQLPNFFAGLAPDDYDVVLEDQNGCQITGIATIGFDPLPVINNIVSVHPLCNGDANGSITITSGSGVGVHQYSMNGGATYQAGATFAGLTAGTYNVVVQDGNLCTVATTVDIIDPPVLGYVAVLTDLICNGDFSGEIQLTANGGTPVYEYSIDNGATFQGGGTFSFVAAGAYNIVIRDNNNCQFAGVENINEPAALAFTTFTIQDPSCFGMCDGVVTTTTAGGTGAHTYQWYGNIATPLQPVADSVCSGTYSVVVTDDNGCQIDSMDFVLAEPPPVPITSAIPFDMSCFTGQGTGDDGQIVITAPSAVLFSIDNGATFQASNVFTGLSVGNYDVVVQNGTGCTNGTNVSIDQPDSLYSMAPGNWYGCFGSVVVIQAFNNGGTPDYNYTWTNNLDATVVNTNVFNYTIDQPAPGVDFTLQITDANGCVAAPVTYNVQSTPLLFATAGIDTSVCPGTNATLYVNANGGELIDFGSYFGYSYVWDTGVAGDTLQTATVSPSTQTMYHVTVTDYCGQTADDSMMVNLFVNPDATFIGGTNGCLPETMTFTAAATPGATYAWDFGDGNTSNSFGTATNLYDEVGCFDVSLTVTSLDGCTVIQTNPSNVCINPPPTPGFYWNPDSPSVLDPTITIVNTADNAEFYVYDFGGLGTSIEEQPTFTFPETFNEITYTVCQQVTSVDGCIAELCQNVFVHEEIIFYVPNVFTPDGDLHNQTFMPVITSGIDMYNYHLTIFNRWGEIVFESYNYDFGWDGTYGDQGLVEDGVYVWQIEFGEKLTDKRQVHRGHVTVLK